MQDAEVIEYENGLTVTITGPQGCGKTLTAQWFRENFTPLVLSGIGRLPRTLDFRPAGTARHPAAPTPPALASNSPDFDEWFKARNGGVSFDALHIQAGIRWDSTIRALLREVRDYVTDITGKALPDKIFKD